MLTPLDLTETFVHQQPARIAPLCVVGFMTFQLLHSTSVHCIHPLWWHTISATRRCSVHQSLKEKGLLLYISSKL